MTDPKCPRCHRRGLLRHLSQTDADGRPAFVCDNCGYAFTNGNDGGIYAALVRRPATEETERP